MKTNNKKSLVFTIQVLSTIIMLSTLELIRRHDIIPSAYIASPSEIYKTIQISDISKNLTPSILTTLKEIIIGVSIATLIGIALGIIMHTWLSP